MLGNKDKLESPIIVLFSISSENGRGGAGGVFSGYSSRLCWCLKWYRSRERKAAFRALGEVERESRKFFFIKETFEMS